ncbi:MAG: electron transport complex subunit RsxC [Bacteroidota bacterium]|nr:electron transport complex subunit RsxC [Bacteroidota bacterium]
MLKTFPKGGVHLTDNKITAGKPIDNLPVPPTVTIPVSQHAGAPAEVLVQVGDKVKVGQLLAQSAGFISGNIHSSVSGTVKKIEPATDSSGFKKPAIIIDVEGDEWLETIDRSETLITEIKASPEEIIQKIKAAGLVGLGGAAFPAHVKLSIPEGKKAECLVINGVECEPYLTCDHRLMLEKSEEILVGIALLMEALNVDKTFIGIEKNKPDAIEKLSVLAKDYPGVSVVPLKEKYPQGSEKQLLRATLGREVPAGALPIDLGAVVFNVGSIFAVYEAVQKNKPLIERVVTVTGKTLSNPSNFKVRIGTPVINLLEAAGGVTEEAGKILSGGPMMGRALTNTNVPIVKGSSGILVLPDTESKRRPVESCIRCGKCVSICCMGLEPFLLMALTERNLTERLEKEKVTNCIECGSCSYTCPSSRPLLDYIRQGKSTVNNIIRARKK